MSTKSKIIITKNHIINLMRFAKINDSISSHAQAFGNESSNSIAFFTTSNLASFHSSDLGENWTLSQNAIGPFGLVQYIPPSFNGRSVGMVNRHNSNSTIALIASKPTVQRHQDYQDQHPEEKTYFTGCMVRDASVDEKPMLSPDSNLSGALDSQRTLTKKRNMETYELIAEHDPSEDSDEDDLNINWGDFEEFKNT